MSNELDQLALKYGADKSSAVHRYTLVYNELLKDRRDKIKRVLEIGVLKGASLRMWQDYFPNAIIHGIDNNKDLLLSAERITCFLVDQSSADSLSDFIHSMAGGYDLMIDDGSHNLDHQILSLNTLFPFLMPGGLYIIEDVTNISDFLAKNTIPNYFVALLDESRSSTMVIFKKE